jgi:hypothetical protein
MISEKTGEQHMGGYGSGRPSTKTKAEDCRSLDVNRFHRKGCLRTGSTGNWVWSRNGEEIAKIGYRALDDTLILDYRISRYDSDWETVSQSVHITKANCHYGGQRSYFICPATVNGRYCGRRVGKLFLGGKYFVCRHCNNLAYSSQSEERHERLLRRANKMRVALGGEAGTVHRVSRPKGMWHRTFQRNIFKINWCEVKADQLFIAKFEGLLINANQNGCFKS